MQIEFVFLKLCNFEKRPSMKIRVYEWTGVHNLRGGDASRDNFLGDIGSHKKGLSIELTSFPYFPNSIMSQDQPFSFYIRSFRKPIDRKMASFEL